MSMEDGSSVTQHALSGQTSELLRDLEIECFATGQNVDIDSCKEILKNIKASLSSTKDLENEASNRLNILQEKLLDQDVRLQDFQLKEHENERLLEKLVNEWELSKERLEQVKKADSVIKYEYQRIKSTNDDLKKHADSVRLLNEDIVKPVMEKKQFELRVATEESTRSLEELEKVKVLLQEVSKQHSNVQSTFNDSLKVLEERKGYAYKIKTRPSELQRNFELMTRKVAVIEEELRTTREQVAASQDRLVKENESKGSIESIDTDTLKKLEEERMRCNRSKDEGASISKALAVDQTKYHSLTTVRVSIEIKLREANEYLRHKRTAAQMQRKQLERMMHLYLKKKVIAERSGETVESLKLKIAEDNESIRDKQAVCADQFKIIEDFKNEISVRVTRLLEQRNIEGDVKNELESIIVDVEEKEIDVDRCRSDVKRLSKIMSVLGCQKDVEAKKTKSIRNDEKNTIEMVKLKSFVVMDMKKALHETNMRAKEFDGLYKALKREKNEIMASSAASSAALAETRHRIDTDTDQLQRLRQSQEEKNNVFLKEKDSHHSSQSNRAILRVDKTNAYSAYRRKMEEVERQKSKIDRLRSIMGCLQRDIIQLKARNDFLENRSKLMSDQMGHKKVELHSLLQRANVLEETLKRGELALEQKKEDIRALQIQCADVERYINAKKSIQSTIKMQREKIKFLKQKLHDEKDQITHLTECLEDPLKGTTNTRWRDLEGEDLDEEQLFAKKEILLQRLSDSKENLMEKEVFLEELSSQRKYLENEVEMCKVKSQPAIKRLNEYQSRVRDVTRSMMSLVSELSMYQATALKLEEDKEAKEDEITKARESIAKGHPPSTNAVRELKRLIRKNCEEENLDHDIDNIDPRAQENEFGKLYYPAKYAFRTTAEPRPSAYIPDVGIEVPKPYGGMAPFKPSKPSDFPLRST